MSVTDIRSETPSSVMNTSISNVSPPRIAPRCVTGACHPANRKSMDWSESCGLIAYGSHGAVVVVDAVSLQVGENGTLSEYVICYDLLLYDISNSH